MKRYVIMLWGILMLIGFMPQEASAHFRPWGGLPLEIGVGLDDFRIENNKYKTDNLGTVFSISVGIQLEMFSLSLDQDFGYIDLTYPSERDLAVEPQKEKLFKGATFVSLGAGFTEPDSTFFVLPKIKLGLGAAYMHNPSYLDGTSGWFAMRFAFGLDFWFSDDDDAIAKLGLIFEYTLGISEQNEFDQRHISNFLAAKLLFAWAKW